MVVVKGLLEAAVIEGVVPQLLCVAAGIEAAAADCCVAVAVDESADALEGGCF